jgi:hypothetical protein
MNDPSQTYSPPTFEDIHNVTSSPESADGATRSDSLAGPTTPPAGLEAALVRASRRPEKVRALMTLATSGHYGAASSESAALQSSLESRLQQRLDTAGSTLFTLTWKQRRTPLGRSYLERAASVRRTSGSGCTSVPTPNTPSGGPNAKSTETHTGGMDLDGVATLSAVPTPQTHDTTTRGNTAADHHYSPHDLSNTAELASVPTPMSGSPATDSYNAAGNNDYSRKMVELASVCSPTSQDCSRGGKPARPWDTGVPLTQQVALATVATPAARDFKSDSATEEFHEKQWEHTRGKPLSAQVCLSETGVDPDGSIRTRLDQSPRQAQLADSGPTATGGTRGTGSTGQLNPEYSRWLMGLPGEFSSCADTVTPSSRKSQRRS